MNTPESTLEMYIKATNSHEFQNVQAVISENAIYYFSDKICSTIEEIKDYFESSWNLIKEEVYSTSNVQWLHRSGDSASCIYFYHYEGVIDGKFIQGSGKATNIFEKIKGKWYLLHEHLSS